MKALVTFWMVVATVMIPGLGRFAEGRTVSFEVLQMEDDPAPGVSGDEGTFGNFLAEGSISGFAGHIAFGGGVEDLSGPPNPGGFWTLGADDTDAELVARMMEPAPGIMPEIDFSSLAAPVTPTGPVDSSGGFVFRGGIPGSVSFGNDYGIWHAGSSGVSLIARTGQGAAGVTDGAEYQGVGMPVLHPNGIVIAFRSSLRNGATDNCGIWRVAGSSVKVVHEGESVTGFGVPEGTTFHKVYEPLVNLATRVGFVASTRGPGGEVGSGFFVSELGTVSWVKEGDPAPGLTPGTVFGAFDYPGALVSWALNFFAFQNLVNDDGVSRNGVWLGTQGGSFLVAATGLDAPGTELPLESLTGNPVLSQIGLVAFRGKLDPNDPGVTTSNDEALFYGPSMEMAPLLREGDPVPGMPGKTVSSFPIDEPFEMAVDGRVAFDMNISPLAGDSIWIGYPDGEVVLLCGDGSKINIDGAVWTVNSADFIHSGSEGLFDITGTNGSDGRPSPFGPNDTFLFTANVTPPGGGSSKDVLVLATVGEGIELELPRVILAVNTPATNDVRITLSSVIGQSYTVRRSSTGAGWAAVASEVPGTGGLLTVDDPGIMFDNPVMLYQVETAAD